MNIVYFFFNFFSFAALALIPGGAVFMVFVALRSATIAEKSAKKAFRKRAALVFIAIFLVIWFGAVFSRETINRYRRKQFFDLEKRNISSMKIIKEGQTFEVKTPSEVASFFTAIREADQVGAHHSHPMSPYLITFPDFSETYSLGPDSDRANEFWFTLAGGPDLRFGEKDVMLMQLQSPALTAWFQNLETGPLNSSLQNSPTIKR